MKTRVSKKLKDELPAAAIHEAGHAVMAWVKLGIGFDFEIDPNTSPVSGSFKPNIADYPHYDLVFVYVAGLAAEYHLTDFTKCDLIEAFGSHGYARFGKVVPEELKKAETLFESIGGRSDDKRSALKTYLETAQCILREHWAAVELISDILLEDYFVSGSVVAQICREGLSKPAQ